MHMYFDLEMLLKQIAIVPERVKSIFSFEISLISVKLITFKMPFGVNTIIWVIK